MTTISQLFKIIVKQLQFLEAEPAIAAFLQQFRTIDCLPLTGGEVRDKKRLRPKEGEF
ncbi:hypothetical protein ACM64M_02145 [Qipengyuania sp. ASV99]